MGESINSGSSIRPVTGDQNRDDTLLSDSHIASSRTPYRNIPISLTWPLIITLVGCGGGGGGARPTIYTQTLTDDLGGIPDGLVFGAATDFFDEMERGFEQGETVNIEIPKNITLDRKGDSYHLTIANLPKGLEFSTRGDQYFIEGTVTSEPSSGSFTVHLTRLYGRPGE